MNTKNNHVEGRTSRKTSTGSSLVGLLAVVLAAASLFGCAETPPAKAPADAKNGQDYWKVDGPQRTGNHNPKQTSR